MDANKLALIVGDEDDICTYLAASLEDNGFETAIAYDGVFALEFVQNRKPDLIILDITMPEQTGVKTYRQLKTDENYKDIPIFVIIGADFMKVYMQKLSGFPIPEAFITKPVDPGELKQMLSKFFPAAND